MDCFHALARSQFSSIAVAKDENCWKWNLSFCTLQERDSSQPGQVGGKVSFLSFIVTISIFIINNQHLIFVIITIFVIQYDKQHNSRYRLMVAHVEKLSKARVEKLPKAHVEKL